VIQETESARSPVPFPNPFEPGGVLPPISRAVLFLFVWFLLWICLPGAVSHFLPDLSGRTQFAIVYVLLDVAVLVESWLFLRAFDRRGFRTLGLWFYPGWLKELARGAGIGAALIGLVAGILLALRAVRYPGLAGAPDDLLPGLAAAAGVLLLAATCEELVFRGYGFQRLVDAFGPLGAVVVFSSLFGVVHLLNPNATILSTASTALSGVLLAVAYLKTRALWLPIGLHWAWNFFMGPVLSLPVSGIAFEPTLLRVQLSGPAWLTGGAYGPEGGVVALVVIIPAIIWLARTRRVATSPAMEEVLE
jgi:membrane protease YdiL (CAAX protease family)